MNDVCEAFPPEPKSLYRYWLLRGCADYKKCLPVIMLNPSHASETTDDQTINNVGRIAKQWRYDSFKVFNLFAFRDPDQEGLWTFNGDRVGPENDFYLKKAMQDAVLVNQPVLVAWGGGNPKIHSRAKIVQEWAKEFGTTLICWRKNKDGTPTHPSPRNNRLIVTDLRQPLQFL